MSEQQNIKFRPKRDVTVSGRIPGELADLLDAWCARRYRKRSEAIGLLLSRVLGIVKEERGVEQAVEDFARCLRFEPA